MRVLVTTTGTAGHFGPMIPFVRAVRDQGGDVLVATRESTADAVRGAGFDVRPFADASDAERGAVFARVGGLSHDEANILVVSEIFAGLDTRASLPGVLDAFETFRPDIVLHETCEFSGGLAAERAGVPGVRVGLGMGATDKLVAGPASARLQEFRAELGLAANPHTAALSPYFTLTPPAMEDPATPGVPGARRFREHESAPAQPLPDWWKGSDAPLVYLTFGSVAPTFGFFPGLYRAAIDALAGLDARVLVTTGRAADPAELAPLPANVHGERWVPQASVMPEAAAMICHGGFGTVRAGLAAGVPMAVVPLFADQPYNARRVAQLGAGVALEGGATAFAGLGDAIRALLDDPAYRAGADAVAAEIRTLPTVDTAAEILRELAAR